ncbi:OmpA family protein [Elizabethkingia sp. JS20170427COW]|uniref:OmpA family protein n=1 Tax=Elizabethkingia sp. JS20170427COW TaxID=2583851 RepID=UPI0011103134|nr:OmpA family protein [Elizabethkingia sp. JS20170427COW]QCX53470.1 OmpA family protein [Elizabethkingia sp. JS20170427COW]
MKSIFASIAALALTMPMAVFGQDTNTKSVRDFSSNSESVAPFNNSVKKYNDWAISAGGGSAIIQTGNITSINNGAGKNLFGWSAYFSVDKMISHAFGLKLQYDKGETRQGWGNTKDHLPNTLAARTQFDAISLLGDVNLSNLFRRVDNRSPYRWALHAYAGVGTLAYRAYLQPSAPVATQMLATEVKPFKAGSLFGQWGGAVKYRATKALDIEARVMYVHTGDNTFDGAIGNLQQITNKTSDNMITAALGLTYNIGKHQSSLFWHDPMQELYYKLDVLENKNSDVEVCKKGDVDNDGVCDDWDRELNTPAGARVDGAGVALDTDLDGVIDLYDKCVTVPGPKENDGCPLVDNTAKDASKSIEGIEFDLNSDRILSSNHSILNNAASQIKSSNAQYKVVGAADDRGTVQYNQKLSERRANSVKNYLIKNGVDASKIQAVGHGKKDLKYPECVPASKCPEWKNRANRRVYFEQK